MIAALTVAGTAAVALLALFILGACRVAGEADDRQATLLEHLRRQGRLPSSTAGSIADD